MQDIVLSDFIDVLKFYYLWVLFKLYYDPPILSHLECFIASPMLVEVKHEGMVFKHIKVNTLDIITCTF